MVSGLLVSVLASSVIVFAALQIGPAAAPSQQSATPTSPSPLVRTAEKKPFAQLFSSAPQKDSIEVLTLAQERTGARAPAPNVVCGMPIVKADPSIDPHMVVPVPSGNFAIRRIVPTVCRPN